MIAGIFIPSEEEMKRLYNLPCTHCPYDGGKCEDTIHQYPKFAIIKDFVYPREGYDYHECSLHKYIKGDKK